MASRLGAKRVVLFAATVVAACLPDWAVAGPKPTHADVKYGSHERNVLDFWKAAGDKPTPLVVYFHGGGFRKGDKSHFYRSSLLSTYYPKGVSFATANYPFLEHVGNDYLAILRHTADCMKFIASKAKEWNVDPRRIAVAGTSAGALISEYIAYRAKVPVTAVFATLQPMGTDMMILPHISRDGPPIIVHNFTGPDDQIHHVRFAKMVGERCKKVGVYCEVWGTKANGLPVLPDGESMDVRVMNLFYKSWRLGPDGKELETPAVKAARLRARQAEAELASAEKLVAEKQYAQAVKQLRLLAVGSAGSDVGKRAAARLKAMREDPAIAASLIETEAKAFEQRCIAAEGRKDYALAIKLYEQYVQQFAKAARFEKVKAHLESLKSDKSIQAAVKSGQASKDCKGWLALADNYAKSGMTDKARQYLAKIIEKYGDTDWGAKARARLDEIGGK